MTPDEFLSRVLMVGECWEWQGYADDKGYGRLWIDGQAIKAHRYSYALHEGDLPPGAFICHRCDNRLCVNPEHLYAGTARSNTADMIERGRADYGVRPVGEHNGASRATASEVAQIRAEHAAGARQKSLAAKYGLSTTQVHRIVHRTHWKHIA